MSPPLFYLPSVDDSVLTLTGEDARHAVKSLRIGAGEVIEIGDGVGAIATCQVLDASTKLVAKVIEKRRVSKAVPSITVFQGLPKAGKLDEIVKTLTQAGVDRIVPVAMKRSVARWDARKAAAQVRRLATIGREAAMQARRAWLPTIGSLIALADVPADVIACTERATERLSALLPREAPDSVGILIGPEGGFDQTEQFEREASLGELIFRTETAPLVALTVVLARYGVLG